MLSQTLEADVLLVEDNSCDAELTIHALKKHNLANRILIVEDGAQALDFLFCRGKFAQRETTSPPKVVVLDLKLPKVDGLEVLKEMRSDERTRTIPAVILTSSSQDTSIKAAYELGANSFVVKPVEFEEFAEAIRTLWSYWVLLNRFPSS